jgi:hypothetical protein
VGEGVGVYQRLRSDRNINCEFGVSVVNSEILRERLISTN